MAAVGMYLFTGKGGAGKTTCAAAFALQLASRGQKTRLASLDPAHNLGDVLRVKLGPDPLEVAPNLAALEADLAAALSAKTEKTRALIQQRYRYLTVAALDPLVDLLGQSPGAEEQVATDVLSDLRHQAAAVGEVLVVDLPPSGQSLRMLALPDLTTRWCNSLLKLRAKILERRGTLNRILKEDSPAKLPEGEACPEDPKHDPVTASLERQLARNQALAKDLGDPTRAAVVVVTLPAAICLTETRRLIDGLAERGIPVSALVLNRAEQTSPIELDPDPGIKPAAVLPDLPDEPRGADALMKLGRSLEGLA
ncbi:MAG TPA: ArsA family ATPase [Myxococcota bacterium]|nr:ArsA family ATPase [Myxococcota bacterium]